MLYKDLYTHIGEYLGPVDTIRSLYPLCKESSSCLTYHEDYIKFSEYDHDLSFFSKHSDSERTCCWYAMANQCIEYNIFIPYKVMKIAAMQDRHLQYFKSLYKKYSLTGHYLRKCYILAMMYGSIETVKWLDTSGRTGGNKLQRAVAGSFYNICAEDSDLMLYIFHRHNLHKNNDAIREVLSKLILLEDTIFRDKSYDELLLKIPKLPEFIVINITEDTSCQDQYIFLFRSSDSFDDLVAKLITSDDRWYVFTKMLKRAIKKGIPINPLIIFDHFIKIKSVVCMSILLTAVKITDTRHIANAIILQDDSDIKSSLSIIDNVTFDGDDVRLLSNHFDKDTSGGFGQMVCFKLQSKYDCFRRRYVKIKNKYRMNRDDMNRH